jgi:hypothetical protein
VPLDKGYKIKKLKEEIKQLKIENKKLLEELNIAKSA